MWNPVGCAGGGGAGRGAVVVNFDETAVARVVQHRRGNMLLHAGSGHAGGGVFERIAQHESHSHHTLMAAVCSHRDLQARVQWILPKDAALSRAERARLPALRPPLVWLQGARGWVTSDSLCAILTSLRRFVRVERPDCDLVFLWDCASQHWAAAVLAHARRWRVPLTVNSRTRGVLPPCAA